MGAFSAFLTEKSSSSYGMKYEEWLQEILGNLHFTTLLSKRAVGADTAPSLTSRSFVTSIFNNCYEQYEHWFGGLPLAMNYSHHACEGRLLAVGSGDGRVQVIQTCDEYPLLEETRRIVAESQSHVSSITDLAFSPPSAAGRTDGDHSLFSASCDSYVVKFDLLADSIAWKLKAHMEWVKRIVFRPGDQIFFAFVFAFLLSNIVSIGDWLLQNEFWTCGSDGIIKRWDERIMDAAVQSLDVTDDSANFSPILRYDVDVQPTWEWQKQHVRFHERFKRKVLIGSKATSVAGLAFVRLDPPVLASCGASDGTVKLWDLRKTTPKRPTPLVKFFATLRTADMMKRSSTYSLSPLSLATSTQNRRGGRGRGILWMQSDQSAEHLALRTMEGVVLVYPCNRLLNKSVSDSRLSDGDRYQPIALLNTVDVEKRRVDYICTYLDVVCMNKLKYVEEKMQLYTELDRPALSGDGRFIALQGERGRQLYVFDLWNSQPEIPRFQMEWPNESAEHLEAISLAWGKACNTKQWAIGTKGGVIKIFHCGLPEEDYGCGVLEQQATLCKKDTSLHRLSETPLVEKSTFSQQYQCALDETGKPLGSLLGQMELLRFFDGDTTFWKPKSTVLDLTDEAFLQWQTRQTALKKAAIVRTLRGEEGDEAALVKRWQAPVETDAICHPPATPWKSWFPFLRCPPLDPYPEESQTMGKDIQAKQILGKAPHPGERGDPLTFSIASSSLAAHQDDVCPSLPCKEGQPCKFPFSNRSTHPLLRGLNGSNEARSATCDSNPLDEAMPFAMTLPDPPPVKETSCTHVDASPLAKQATERETTQIFRSRLSIVPRQSGDSTSSEDDLAAEDAVSWLFNEPPAFSMASQLPHERFTPTQGHAPKEHVVTPSRSADLADAPRCTPIFGAHAPFHGSAMGPIEATGQDVTSPHLSAVGTALEAYDMPSISQQLTQGRASVQTPIFDGFSPRLQIRRGQRTPLREDGRPMFSVYPYSQKSSSSSLASFVAPRPTGMRRFQPEERTRLPPLLETEASLEGTEMPPLCPSHSNPGHVDEAIHKPVAHSFPLSSAAMRVGVNPQKQVIPSLLLPQEPSTEPVETAFLSPMDEALLLPGWSTLCLGSAKALSCLPGAAISGNGDGNCLPGDKEHETASAYLFQGPATPCSPSSRDLNTAVSAVKALSNFPTDVPLLLKKRVTESVPPVATRKFRKQMAKKTFPLDHDTSDEHATSVLDDKELAMSSQSTGNEENRSPVRSAISINVEEDEAIHGDLDTHACFSTQISCIPSSESLYSTLPGFIPSLNGNFVGSLNGYAWQEGSLGLGYYKMTLIESNALSLERLLEINAPLIRSVLDQNYPEGYPGIDTHNGNTFERICTKTLKNPPRTKNKWNRERPKKQFILDGWVKAQKKVSFPETNADK
ncbi:hypothetical protein IE077_002168 [Cardiosporidium cionae]|uniref:Uncharacterized protein n=1 Tax=Cardiosporidium cionae TaxID=476202 RepID=A0ABQ7JBD9_9APIC|nr:hypothetical protein IE077_002168 [Cardiosporidium cionae]|eukprot:KAF8821306.1 hypothetical protein IE077_002168 [Cardiosporidium cionae]